MSESSFPISSELYEDESGLGFCLRAATVNGGNLAALRQLLNIGPSARIKAAHAARLAQWLGVDKFRLEQRLPVFLLRANGARRFCYGHFFRQPGALRSNHPQLCSHCISEKGYLKDVWDLTLATCCLEHRLLLTGRCHQCQSVIKWDRKGVQWATCRHHLGTAPKTTVAGSDLLSAQLILQASFRSMKCHSIAKDAGLPTWLSGLSVDGWMQVFYAFGLLKSAWVSLCPKELSQCLPPADAQEVVSRGIRRLQGFRNIARFENWSAVVARAPIVNLMICPTGPLDQAIGCQLFKQIFGRGELDIVARKYPQLAQLELFDEHVL